MATRKIPEFPEYQVSDSGVVTRNGKELSPSTNDDGYSTVVLYKDGEPNFKYVQDLVASAFVANPDGKKLVNHQDGDKSNNTASNLNWADNSENTEHSYDTLGHKGPRGELNGKSKLTDKQVASIRKAVKSGAMTGADAARKHGVSRGAISRIVTDNPDAARWNHAQKDAEKKKKMQVAARKQNERPKL